MAFRHFVSAHLRRSLHLDGQPSLLAVVDVDLVLVLGVEGNDEDCRVGAAGVDDVVLECGWVGALGLGKLDHRALGGVSDRLPVHDLDGTSVALLEHSLEGDGGVVAVVVLLRRANSCEIVRICNEATAKRMK